MPKSRTAVPVQRRNVALDVALAKNGQPKYVVAGQARINASTLAGIISGRVIPSRAVRARLAAVLGVPEDELFEPDGVSA